jgi:hypothetical protein
MLGITTPAKYDARMTLGQWAYLCQPHWETNTEQQLGTGFGQELIQA